MTVSEKHINAHFSGGGLLTPCPNCGSERFWQRSGSRNGVPRYRQKCALCHRKSLAKDRAKHGGAAARNRVWEAKNREKALAHKKVESHLRAGNIVRRPCQICGSSNSQAHHDDYSIPLEIMWLCPIHHAERHRQLAAGDSSPLVATAGEAVPQTSPVSPATHHASRNGRGEQ